jgi:hypothetical protein
MQFNPNVRARGFTHGKSKLLDDSTPERTPEFIHRSPAFLDGQLLSHLLPLSMPLGCPFVAAVSIGIYHLLMISCFVGITAISL